MRPPSETPLRDFSVLSQPDDSNKEFDLSFLWTVIQSKRWLIFTMVAIAFALSVIHGLQAKDFYNSSTKILIERSDQSAYQNPELLKPQFEAASVYYETRVEIVRSRPILERTVHQLHLVDHYRKYDSKVEHPQQAIQILHRKIKVKVLRNTQIIEVIVSDFDATMAANIANTMTDNFIKESWRERLFLSDQLLKWFPQESETLQNSTGMNQLRALDKIDTAEAVLSLPSVMQDPVINRIKQDQIEIDAKIKEFSRRYTTEHPKMKELLARGEYLQSEMKVQIEKIVLGLKSGLAGQFSVGNAKVIENATAPESPAGPNRLFITVFAVLSSLAGALILAVFLHYLDHNVKTEEDIKGIPSTFLGYFPLFSLSESNGSTKKSLAERVNEDPKLQDAIANIKASILFSMPAERSKLIMVTSTLPEEGKTTLSLTLAMALSQGGEKVLLIDADLRKPAAHKLFNLKNEEGLTNCLVEGMGLETMAQRVDESHELYVLTSGPPTPNPSVLLGSSAIDRLLENAVEHFDRVIIDVPPSLHIADGLILAAKVHGVVLVFNRGKVHIDVARKLKEKMGIAGGVIIGAIINKMNYNRAAGNLYFNYYRQYHKYYDVQNPTSSSTRNLTSVHSES